MSEVEVTQAQELPAERVRLRIVYSKGESIKFISHHDEFRLWERTLRRAGLPLQYKQGFNPQPHMQFASPLGVGITGERELLDIILTPPLPLEEVRERITAKLPPAVTVSDVHPVELHGPSLQSLVIGSDYTVIIYAEPSELAPEELEQRVAAFLAEPVCWRERERKGEAYTYNLRPLVFVLDYHGYDAEAEQHRIFLRVQQRSGATGRPDELVDALGLDDFARTLRRDRIYLEDAPDDVAVFAAYPVVSQAEITGQPGTGRSLRQLYKEAVRKSPTIEPGGTGVRSINERASDEFA